MDWSAVTRRVAVEAVEAHPEDVVAEIGGGGVLAGLAGRVRRGISVDLARAEAVGGWWEAGISVVVMHDALRMLPPDRQARLIAEIGRRMAARGLLVIGDVVWSMPPEQLDEPEQYGAPLAYAPTASALEQMARSAGFLPDLHRFGPGRAVLIALRAG